MKATVSDRKAVFELAQTTGSNKEVPGVRNIPLDLNLLRSKQLTDIGDYKITGLSIRRSLQDYPTIVRFVQGDEKTGQQPTWMYTAEGLFQDTATLPSIPQRNGRKTSWPRQLLTMVFSSC